MPIRVFVETSVAKTISSGVLASFRRSGSSVHSVGRHNTKSMGNCSGRVATVRLTPIWQLVTLPAEPVYWRFTPTERVPCLRKPVSSMIHRAVVGGNKGGGTRRFGPPKKEKFEVCCSGLKPEA